MVYEKKFFSGQAPKFRPENEMYSRGIFLLTDPAILPKNELNNRGVFSGCQKGGEKTEKQATGHGL